MFVKNIVIFFACVFFLELTLVHGQSHVINDCIDPGDNPVLIYDEEVSKPSRILHTWTDTVRIPAQGLANKDISCFTVTNLDKDTDGGYPTIIEGGVGYNYVIVQLKSQFGKGYDFRLTAYYSG